ncbi:alpha-galactosidase [Streptococcus suis]|uniref:alpha-galactosidase n=1 Tax=Streptococcus suis TaxID=1307 RepID=UPI000CF61B81|nr:alpha-galactosidase [Streptococcus suis]
MELINVENGIFHLNNNEISYIFSIEEGKILSHLYFGKKVKNYHGHRKQPRVDRAFSGNLANSKARDYSLDTILREYSGTGEGDYRLPSVIVRQENGSLATRFRYSSYEIVKGKPHLKGLPQTYVDQEEEAETLIIYLEDSEASLGLYLYYTIFSDRNVIARSARMVNQSNKPIQIEKLASLSLDFSARSFEVISFPGAHAHERQMERQKLQHGQMRFMSRRGTTSHQMNNSMVLVSKETTEHSGDAYGVGLIYSGNHALELEKDQLDQVRLVVGINEEMFSWELSPSESFQTPEAILVYSDKGLNKMSQTFHSLITKRIARGPHRDLQRPILVNNWEATYFDFNEEKIKSIIQEAKKLGIEMFVLDDGWFGQRDEDDRSLGDWFENKRKLGNSGLAGIASYVKEAGMKFGLWFEPEMISIDSDLYRRHPEFLMKIPNREALPSRQQFVLDMGQEQVRKNIISQMEKLLDQGFIDYIKWDMNRHLSDVYSLELPPHKQAETSHRYVLGLYEVLEYLTTKYPTILWEGCSGGGGRFDMGFAYYMPQSWTSDNTDAVARLAIQYGTSLIYPPSVMTSHVSAVPNHQTGRVTPLDTRGYVSMGAVFGYELDLTALTEDEKNLICSQINQYKEIRELIQYGRFTRLLSPFDGNRCAWMFTNQDASEAVVFVFQILSHAQPILETLRLEELDLDGIYEEQRSLQCYGGDELRNIGLYLPIQKKDFASTYYHFKKIN